MAVALRPVLDILIAQFAATPKAERTSRFAQIDLAAQILLHFGYAADLSPVLMLGVTVSAHCSAQKEIGISGELFSAQHCSHG